MQKPVYKRNRCTVPRYFRGFCGTVCSGWVSWSVVLRMYVHMYCMEPYHLRGYCYCTTYCAFTIAQYVHSIAQSGVQTGWTQAVVLLVLSIHILSGEKSRVAFIHIHVHNLLFFPIYVSITHADHMLLHKYSCMHQQTVLHVLGSALYTYVCTS